MGCLEIKGKECRMFFPNIVSTILELHLLYDALSVLYVDVKSASCVHFKLQRSVAENADAKSWSTQEYLFLGLLR